LTNALSPQLSAEEWWARRRLRYNVGLVSAGLLAFACYVAVVFWGISLGAIPDAGAITLLTTVFQGVGYLFMMGIANLCYLTGPLLEQRINPKDICRYRRTAFGLGFWFSVALPFSVPALLAWLSLTRPPWWHG
jgi:hypothetical protein